MADDLAFKCEHTILRDRCVQLRKAISNLHEAVDALSKAGNSYPAIGRAIESSERMLRYADAAIGRLRIPCAEGCRG